MRLFMIFAVLLPVAFASPQAAAERRVALVIGVAAYRSAEVLKNTLNDAKGVTAALLRLDFKVDTVLDPDRSSLEAAVRRFGTTARGADVALVFYAGHAVEFGGRNWLIPVTADVHSGRDLRFETLDVDDILEQLDGAAKLSILILDACRDNPFRGLRSEGRGVDAGRGLARMQAAVGTLIAFATAPGTVAADGAGAHSPFTTALLKRIETPGLEFRQMMAEVRRDVRQNTGGKQVPWEESAMEGSLYLRGSPIAINTPAHSDTDPDTLFWESVRDTQNPADFRAYLTQFPNGVFSGLARNRLAGNSATEPVTQEDYSSGDKVVLPLRLRPNLANLYARISAALALAGTSNVANYARLAEKKALALHVESKRTFYWDGVETQALADQLALEGCEQTYAGPCVLVASGATLLAPDPRASPRRDMARLHYQGSFKADQVPFEASVPAFAAYPATNDWKAIAVRPTGARVKIVQGAASAGEAERQALDECNADGSPFPCFVYARGNQVVLTERRTEARP